MISDLVRNTVLVPIVESVAGVANQVVVRVFLTRVHSLVSEFSRISQRSSDKICNPHQFTVVASISYSVPIDILLPGVPHSRAVVVLVKHRVTVRVPAEDRKLVLLDFVFYIGVGFPMEIFPFFPPASISNVIGIRVLLIGV